jgi:hypothetical protein
MDGAPDTIRTCDLCLRRATLYPAELRVRCGSFSRLAGGGQRPSRSWLGRRKGRIGAVLDGLCGAPAQKILNLSP